MTEVRRGLATGRDRVTFDDAMDDVPVVPFGRSEARRAADRLRRLDVDGAPIGVVAAMISATVLERNEKVLTRNVSGFDRVDGLRVVPYRSERGAHDSPRPTPRLLTSGD